MRMAMLKDNPTVADVRDFLLKVIDSADDRPTKGNPSITKEQFWNLYMGMVLKADDESKPFSVRCWPIAVKNLNREFGYRE